MSDRYQLKRQLGHGGMAEVYLAEARGAEGFSKPVVLKRVLPQLGRDERVARMFVAEAKLATYLHHQNVVEVFDVGRGPQGLFIAMELVDGWDLAVVGLQAGAKKLAFPPPLAAFIATQVLAGLSHAYRRSKGGRPIITAHRDISPGNILVSREGEVKVTDFGIAKVEAETGLTDPGTFKGKLAYAAPEVLRGELANQASDEFSLAVTLYELLALRHPFGNPSNPATYIETLVNQAPGPIEGLPPAAWEILQRMLSVLPEARFGSADALARAWGAQLGLASGSPASARDLADFLGTLALPPSPLDDSAGGDAPAISLTGAAWLGEGIEPPEEWRPPEAQLDVSGRVTVPPRSKSPPTSPPPGSAREPERLGARAESEVGQHSSGWSAAAEPALELAYDPYASRAPGTELPRRRRTGILLALVGLVAAGLAAAFWAPTWTRWLPLPQSAGGAHRLRLESEPAGAMVKINGNSMGETPLFIDNLYPPGEVKVEVTMRGYRPWSGTFRGSEEAVIEAKLVRK